MADKYFSILNVEAGKTEAGLIVNQLVDGTAQYDAVNVFGQLNGAIVTGDGYIGVGNGGITDTVAVAAARFDVWNGGTARNTTLWADADMFVMDGGTARNTTLQAGADMFVMDGAVAHNTTVNVGGGLHVTGKAYDVAVRGGFVGVGANGLADDVNIQTGRVDVYAGGLIDDAIIFGLPVTANRADAVINLWNGAKAKDIFVSEGQVNVAGGAFISGDDNTVALGGDLTFYNIPSGWAGTGEISVGDGGSINTWGKCAFDGTVTFEFGAGAAVTDKVRLDDASVFNSLIGVEVESDVNAGRYLVAGNARGWLGYGITFSDGDLEYLVQVGGLGVQLNDKTYSFNIDANDNLYMDVVDGTALWPYAATNTVGAGNFGNGVGVQQVWSNADKSVLAIAGIGPIAAPGEFVGIGDFDGNGLDDLLFANGDNLTALFFGTGNVWSVDYANALAGGTMADSQIATTFLFNDQDTADIADDVSLNASVESVFVKYADVFREMTLFDATTGAYTNQDTGNFTTCVQDTITRL